MKKSDQQSAASDQQEPKGYELVLSQWAGQILPDWEIEIFRAEQWYAAPTGWPLYLFVGQKIRARTAAGQAILEQMLAHGYLKEVI